MAEVKDQVLNLGIDFSKFEFDGNNVIADGLSDFINLIQKAGYRVMRPKGVAKGDYPNYFTTTNSGKTHMRFENTTTNKPIYLRQAKNIATDLAVDANAIDLDTETVVRVQVLRQQNPTTGQWDGPEVGQMLVLGKIGDTTEYEVD